MTTKSWKATKADLNARIKSWLGTPYRSLVRRSWEMSTDEFWNCQTQAFKRLYAFARRRVPFYMEHSDIYPALPTQKDDGLEFLARLPILRKQTVKKRNSELWASPLPPLTRFHTTSGTTGTPLRLTTTLQERGLAYAAYEEWLLHTCGTRRPRALYLSGFMVPSEPSSELFWSSWLSNVYLSIYSLNASKRDEIVDLINRLKPRLIYSYASALYDLARVLDGTLEASKDSRVAVVTADVLHPEWRTTIEESLCSSVFDFYGAQEGSHIAAECKEGSMHINPLIGIIEILDENDEPVEPGKIGRVVVTGLVRKSMPLIRYELGDLAESTGYASDCPCGLKWPTIGRVYGRDEDFIVTRDGRRIGHLDTASTKRLRGIKESQFIQKGYEKFICNIVKSEVEPVDSDYLEQAIRAEMARRLQVDIDITFNFLAEIPRGPRGKFRTVIVDFDEGEASSQDARGQT